MSDSPPKTTDLFGWGLLALGFVLAAAVLSHDPSLPPSGAVYPSLEKSENLIGPSGHEVATVLYDSLGLAVYLLLASWFTLVLMLLMREKYWLWWKRLGGWVVLIPCVAIAADVLEIPLAGGSRFGPGGSIGAWLHMRLLNVTSSRILAIIVGCCGAVGMILALDFFLIALARTVGKMVMTIGRVLWSSGGWVMTRVFRRGKSVASTKPSPTKTPESIPEPEEDKVIPINHPAPEPEPGPEKEQQGSEPDEEPSEGPDEEPAPSTLVVNRPEPLPSSDLNGRYELPPIELLDDADPFPYEEHDEALRSRAVQLGQIFQNFDLNVKVVGINTGPVITQYEISLETGLRVNKVTRLAEDIALGLAVVNVRIVAPIPGKNTVGIEVPNEHREIVRLKEVILAPSKKANKAKLPLFLGKDSEGQPLVYDLADMPHLLIAGRTGTGKSVALNSIILSMLMTRRPDEVKMLMIDPKCTELNQFSTLPHLMHPVVTDMKKAEQMLAWAVDKMEQRYDLLSRAKVRSIASYNTLSYQTILDRLDPSEEEIDRIPEKMPYIAIVIDEVGDLMAVQKREVEGHIIRLAQKSRAAGIHLILATQKPTVDVITGLIKSNLPARICFQVASRTDSRVVLDEMGAEKLLGKGDMLFLQPGTSSVVRAQGTYASDEEIVRIVEAIDGEPEFSEELMEVVQGVDSETNSALSAELKARDPVYEQAIEIVVAEGRGSVSLLQRALGIGYGRAARLIDFMAEDGIVGPYRGSNAREVLLSPEQWNQRKAG
ncbi:MAG: DNA translocase FtsK 4TM domain-containing protein [Gemmataceae bacterium]